ncbi:MAG: hypothetical protein WCQ20_09555 [Synechococcaceae cyanobacterium ELA739]
MPWRLRHRSRTVAAPAAGLLTLALLLPLAGCQSLPLLRRQTLHVTLALSPGMEWLSADFRGGRSWTPLLTAFGRVHPEVHVQFSVVPEANLADELARSHRQGLGPDLLLVRGTMAKELLEQGLTSAMPRSAEVQATVATIESRALHAVRTPRGLAGLPVFSEPSLACYNNKLVGEPPASTEALLALAAGGQPIGLSVDPVGLWWSVGALGARQAMLPLLTGTRPPATQQEPDRLAIVAWLSWLRQAAQQSRVDLASGPEELAEGLESGRLAWIPCFSLAIPRLQRAMGKRLGVAPLPSGPGGLPSPYSALRVWALGADSSDLQRRLAIDLARFALDPGVQRGLALETHVLVPVNRFAAIPVASSGRLAALAEAQRQYQQTSIGGEISLATDRMVLILPTIQSVISQVMEGVISPRQGAEVLLKLESKR